VVGGLASFWWGYKPAAELADFPNNVEGVCVRLTEIICNHQQKMAEQRECLQTAEKDNLRTATERERERAKKEHSKHITFLVWCANFWCGVVVWWSGESDWCGLKKIGCGVWIFVDARAREYL